MSDQGEPVRRLGAPEVSGPYDDDAEPLTSGPGFRPTATGEPRRGAFPAQEAAPGSGGSEDEAGPGAPVWESAEFDAAFDAAFAGTDGAKGSDAFDGVES